MLSFLKKIFSKKTVVSPPEGVCPNCWGRQEYQDMVYEAIKKEEINVKKIEDRKGWIRAYAMQNLPKLWLKDNGGTRSCPSCHIEYKEIKEK